MFGSQFLFFYRSLKPKVTGSEEDDFLNPKLEVLLDIGNAKGISHMLPEESNF